MSCYCDLCGKKFTSKHRQQYHKHQTKYPCNLKCRTCGVKLLTKKKYQQHQLANHSVSNNNDDDDNEREQDNNHLQVAAAPVAATKPIAIEDFDRYMLQVINEMPTEELLQIPGVEVEHVREQVVGVRTFVNEHGNIQRRAMRYTRETQDLIITRVWEARKALSSHIMALAMRTMENSSKDMAPMAINILYEMWHQDTNPRLHNICLSDTSRGTVKAFSRDLGAPQGSWKVHPKTDGMRLVRDQAKKLLSFMLEAGTRSLKCAVWRNIECLALEGRLQYSIILYKKLDETLKVEWVPTRHVLYYEDEEGKEADPRLLDLIHQKKDEMLEQLKHLIIANENLEKCLRDTRAFCIKTMKETTK